MPRFAHIADTHLGFEQYGSIDRYHDFAKAWVWCCAKIMAEQCDFVIHSGDLFHHRLVDAYTLSQATDGLKLLDIPVFIIEGNHEKGRTVDEISWLYYLEYLGLLEIIDSRKSLREYKGVQIYGLPWEGAATVSELEKIKRVNDKFSILMLHAGIDKFLNRKHPATIPYESLPDMGYIATGHIHMPYNDEVVYNPGSTEANAIDEIQWPDRGFYIVDTTPFEVRKIVNPRRKFYRVNSSELPIEAIDQAAWHVFIDDGRSEETITNLIPDPIVVKFKRPKKEKVVVELSNNLESTIIDSLDCDAELLRKLKLAALEEKEEGHIFDLVKNVQTIEN